MCYWFERSGDYIRCEVRQVDGRFELTVVRPDGAETVEHYNDSDRLHYRQLMLERRFMECGWKGPHGRSI